MNGQRIVNFVIGKIAQKLFVALLRRRIILGAETHKMVGVKVRRKTAVCTSRTHMFCNVAQNLVACLITVCAVDIAESVKIVSIHTVFFAWIFFKPFGNLFVKSGRVVKSRFNIHFACKNISYILARNNNTLFFAVKIRIFYLVIPVAAHTARMYRNAPVLCGFKFFFNRFKPYVFAHKFKIVFRQIVRKCRLCHTVVY